MKDNEWILYIKHNDYGRKTKHNITSEMSRNNASKTVPQISQLKCIYNILTFVNKNIEGLLKPTKDNHLNTDTEALYPFSGYSVKLY